MRLSAAEIAAVRRIVAEHFGPEAEVRVFGSRADPTKRGGDPDLRVIVPGPVPPPAETGLRAADAIERAPDDRHVDLIVPGRDEPRRRID